MNNINRTEPAFPKNIDIPHIPWELFLITKILFCLLNDYLCKNFFK